MRLEKYIATAGIASRRAAKKQILAGAVTVNGEPVSVPGHRIDVATDTVCYNGQPVRPLTEHTYLMLNKPAGYLTTRHDERGRPTVMALIADRSDTLYPVGRLDLETEGLLLFTNDGDFAYRLLHPSHEIEKTYIAWVRGTPSGEAIRQLRRGITIPSGQTAPAKIRRLKRDDTERADTESEIGTKFEVTIHEGKKRQIRLMFKAVGHPVLRLKRVRIGGLGLGDLQTGAYRHLTETEVSALMRNMRDKVPRLFRNKKKKKQESIG